MALSAIVLAARVAVAVDVTAKSDKTFDFSNVHTWGWNPLGPGVIRMARTASDDPEAIRQRAEPVIVDEVAATLGRRGLQISETPDIHVTYYLLLSTGSSAQTIGQFLPPFTEWGVPPFTPSTQSLEVVNQGSLILDVAAKEHVVWRGTAQAKIKMDTEEKRRTALIRQAVADLLRRLPSK